jgi:invasion protein IalB
VAVTSKGATRPVQSVAASLRRVALAAIASITFLALTTGTEAQQAAAPFPGGANTIVETFEDWLVRCAREGDAMHCILLQTQNEASSGQHLLTVELRPLPDDRATGNLVLPFGLSLERGATLQIDEREPLATLSFRTCLPVGCVIALQLSATDLDALRQGGVLKVSVRPIDSDSDVSLPIPLHGFLGAFARSAELIR